MRKTVGHGEDMSGQSRTRGSDTLNAQAQKDEAASYRSRAEAEAAEEAERKEAERAAEAESKRPSGPSMSSAKDPTKRWRRDQAEFSVSKVESMTDDVVGEAMAKAVCCWLGEFGS